MKRFFPKIGDLIKSINNYREGLIVDMSSSNELPYNVFYNIMWLDTMHIDWVERDSFDLYEFYKK